MKKHRSHFHGLGLGLWIKVACALPMSTSAWAACEQLIDPVTIQSTYGSLKESDLHAISHMKSIANHSNNFKAGGKFGAISGNASGSRSNSAERDEDSDIRTYEQEIVKSSSVTQSLISAFVACKQIEYGNKPINVDPFVYGPASLSINLTPQNDRTGLNLTGLEVLPAAVPPGIADNAAKLVTCTAILPDGTIAALNSDATAFKPLAIGWQMGGSKGLSITCKREKVRIDTGTAGAINHYLDVTVKLVFDAQDEVSYALTWPGDSIPDVQTVNAINRRIAELDEFKASLTTSWSRNNTSVPGPPNVPGAPTQLTCPEGQYLTGLDLHRAWNVRQCSGCLDSVAATCRPLPGAAGVPRSSP